jgi:hypothetical protein
MSVEINIPPVFQQFTNNTKSANVNGSTVAGCLEELVKQYPLLKSRLFTGKGELLQGLNIFINGETAYPGALAKPVRDGDKLYVTYIVMGG